MKQKQPSPHTATLRIYLLGRFRLEKAGTAVAIRHSKARQLLAYLLLHTPRVHLREALGVLLWPDAPPDRVGRNLSDALYRLRQALGEEWLRAERDTLTLAADADLWVDVWAFQAQSEIDAIPARQQAIDLYTGPLLPDVYDDWVLAPRQSLREQYLENLRWLGNAAAAAQQPQQALAAFRRLVTAAPLREAGHRGLMRALAAVGRFAEALAAYDTLADTLTAELDVDPAADTQALRAQLQAEWDVAQQREKPAAGGNGQLPFVGRMAERRLLIDALEGVRHGRGGIVVVEGEAGMGKSRLLHEAAKSARWRKIETLTGAAEAHTAVSPYSPLTDALAAALDGPRAVQLETLLPPETLAAAALLHPAWETLADLSTLPPDAAQTRLRQAITAVCATLARLGPQLLLLDDMHWAGADCWQALDALAALLAETPLLLLLAYRRAELEPQPSWQTVAQWERDGRLQTVSLPPLTEDDVAQLLPAAQQPQAAAVLAGAGGNPYYVSELLHGLQQGGAAVRETAVTRAAALPDAAQTALAAAAVIGGRVPYRLWAEVTALPPLALAQASEQLVQRYLLAVDGRDFRFTHDLVQEAVYAQLPPAQRQTLHHAVAQAQAAADAASTQSLRARAYHLQQAGETAAAAALYRRIGLQNAANFAYAEAQAALTQALALDDDLPPAELLTVYQQLVAACEVTDDLAQQEAALAAALPLAEAQADTAALIVLLISQGHLLVKQGDYGAAKAALRRGLQLARAAADAAAQAEIQYYLGDLALRLGDNQEALTAFETAVSLARQAGSPAIEGRALDGWGYMLSQMAHPLHLFEPYFEKAIALHRESGNPLDEARTLVNYFTVLQNAGAWDRVLAMAETVIAAMQAIPYRRGMAIAYQTYGLTASQLGDDALAEQCLQRAQAGFVAVGEPLGAAIATAALGTAAHQRGDVDAAAAFYAEALQQAQRLEASTFIAFAHQGWGEMLVDEGEWEMAVSHLQPAVAIWTEQEDRLNQLRCEAYLGLAYCGLARSDAAAELAAAGWRAFQEFDAIHGENRELWLWALARLCAQCELVEASAALVRAAYAELQTHARALADEDVRHQFFTQVPANLAIVQAYDALENISRSQQVSLAHEDAPLGRPLTPAEMVPVTWTVHAAADEAIENKTERRRSQLKRLLAEAAAHHAAPSDDDCAQALGVSRRTILRDMKALAAEGVELPTRGR